MEKIKINETNEYLYYKKINNGLEIFILPNNNQKNYYITFNTKFGSINTEFKKNNEKEFIQVPNGIAHYIEHLKFNLENGSAFDFFSKLGASVNAFTSYDITCYEVYSSTYFKENLSYLLEYVQTPYFTQQLVNNERDIIKEEINMYDNNPNTKLTYKTYENIFINDKRKYLISGEVEDIKKITLNNILDCYNTFYNPNNMFIVITGNVEPYEALAIIEENQKSKEFKNVDIINKEITEQFKVNKEYEEKEMNVEINKISISYKIPKKNFNKLKLNDEELYIYISILFDILYGPTSDIQDKLVSSSIIQNGIDINKTYTDDYIIISLMTESDYTETLINMIKETLEEINITEEELLRKIKVYKSNYILHFDDIESVNNNIQDNIIQFNKVITNYIDIYNDINLETLYKVIECLENKKESILIIKPISKNNKE